MKRIHILALIIFIATILVNAEALAKPSDKDQMANALLSVFNSSKGQASGYSVHDWTLLNHQFQNIQDLKQEALKINQNLNIPSPKENVIQKEGQNVYQLFGVWSGNRSVSIVLTSMKTSDSPTETTVVIRVEKESADLADYASSVSLVQDTLKQLSGTPNFSTCIQGFLDVRMTNGERNRLLENMMIAVHAKEVEGMRTDLVSSVSGYSSQIPSYIKTNGNKMNLQVAVHDDSVYGKTRIVVGAPIITVTY